MKLPVILALSGLLCAGVFAPGFARKANTDEMAKLKEQEKAAEVAEKKLTELKAEKAKLEAELAAKKQELQKAEEDLSAVKAKVGR